MSKTLFNIGSFRTFAAFNEAGASYIADVNERSNQVAKIYLGAAVLNAMRSPGATVSAILDGAIEGLSQNPATVANYRSQMVKAITFARTKAILPTLDANVGEADVLAKVATFCDKYTLRGLYDEARKPAQAKAEERKETRETAAATAEAEARTAAGVEGETGLNVAKLIATVSLFMDAANGGDVNAARVLAHLEATLFADRKAREEAAAAPLAIAA